jgi:hypothetical protein
MAVFERHERLAAEVGAFAERVLTTAARATHPIG